MKIFKTIKKNRTFLLTILFIILAFLIFGINAFNKNVWYDEAFQMVLNNYKLKEILFFVKNDTSPPLYAILLKLCTTILDNNSLYVGRLLSLSLFSIQFILAFYPIKKLFGIKTSIIYSTIILLSFFSFFASLEIRLYSMSMTASLGAVVYALLYLQEKNIKDLILYIIFGIVGVYSHNYTILAVFSLIALTTIIALIKKESKKIIYGNIIIAASFIPWVSVLYKQIKNVSGSFWIFPPSLTTFSDALQKLINPNYIIILIMVTILIISIIFSNKRKETIKNSLFVLLPFLLSVGAFIIISYIKTPLFVPKYLVPVCGLFYLSISIILSNNKYIPYVILFILLMIPNAISNFKIERKNNNDLSTIEMIDFINTNVKGKKVFYNFSENDMGLSSYYFPNSKHYINNAEEIVINNPEIFGEIVFKDDFDVTDDTIIIFLAYNTNDKIYLRYFKPYYLYKKFNAFNTYNAGYTVYILNRK